MQTLPQLADRGLGPDQPFAGRVRQHPHPTALQLEIHQGFEVGVVLSGRVERHSDGFVLLASAGDVWLNPPWEPHGWRVVAAGTTDAVFYFLPEFISDQIFEGPRYLSLFWAPVAERPRVLTIEQREAVLAVTRFLVRELEEKRRGWRSAAQLCLLGLLHTLGRDWEPRSQPAVSERVRAADLERISPALRLVYECQDRRVPIPEAAAACRLSSSQFRQLFRQTMGLGFGSFCRRTRLALVAHLLLSTDLTVEESAGNAGFVDGSHLHRLFVKRYGCTPAEYRDYAVRPPQTGAGERPPGPA